MSVIYDALKKLQKQKPKEPFSFKAKTNRESKNFLVYFVFLILIIALFIGIRHVLRLQPKEKSPINNIAPSSAPPATQVATLETETQLSQDEESKPLGNIEPEAMKEIPEFKLQGVLSAGSEYWALIDDRILKPGEIIKGAKITKVTQNSVELLFEDKTIVLRVER